ncbi:UNVERIFIED_CONTAM: hypothetical protein GTU68_001271 [Idotea baltica]|nr:hypothetical protein [Idotea baltica]
MAAHDLTEDCFAIDVISTAGDRIQDRALNELGGKGLFTEEIEERLLSGELDMAVHSSKDMPTVLPEGLELTTILPREDPTDAFLSHKAKRLEDLPHGSVVGSASLRRQAMIKRRRPDLKLVNLRGNVDTRIRKLADGDVDAALLATAGLNRTGLSQHITSRISTDEFMPAVGQGAVCVEVCCQSTDVKEFLAPIHHYQSGLCLWAERAFLRELDGSCRTPIAAFATIEDDILSFRGMILSTDGQTAFETSRVLKAPDDTSAAALGKEAGQAVRKEAGESFLKEILFSQHVLETR